MTRKEQIELLLKQAEITLLALQKLRDQIDREETLKVILEEVAALDPIAREKIVQKLDEHRRRKEQDES